MHLIGRFLQLSLVMPHVLQVNVILAECAHQREQHHFTTCISR